ncbi:MAG: RNA pseudouridine synthase [Gammaproteobacteria bacterium RIFCSPHIGHO2_12_FULL_40_19]|nr:MAG: RNA pseudouridine synthase [Gammaproteobacteria bacterium RIFCSPHIGHO2_12_FULL_40_19]
MKTITLQNQIPEALANQRLDVALSQIFPDYSRNQIQQWIRDGYVQLNGKVIQKPRHEVVAEQNVIITAEITEQTEWEAQEIPLDIIYEDDTVMIINKPVGLIVHPGAGNPDQTLVNALLHHEPALSLIPRAGVIHRLDKETSGLLVIAKTLAAHNALIKQMQAREIEREYRAIVHGTIISGGTIDLPLGRHPTQRTKMAVRESGKEAITHYRVLEHFREHTLLLVKLETGRTHQIRVHFAHYNYPIVGDPAYGKRGQYQYPELSEATQIALKSFTHQALHAHKLALIHPVTKKRMEWKAPLPDDMEHLLTCLRSDEADLADD